MLEIKFLLEDLGVEVSSYAWIDKDYYQIREKWLEKGLVNLTQLQLEDIHYFAGKGNVKMFDVKNRKETLNTPEMKNYIRNLKEASVFN